MKKTCDLIRLLHQNISESDANLEYKFVESVAPLLKDLLYEAVIKKDIASQVKLGKMLASSEFDDTGCSPSGTEGSNYCYNPDPLQRKLAYQILNDAVESNSAEGMFTIGNLLIQKGGLTLYDTDEKEKFDIVHLLKTASDVGHFEAKALFSTYILCRLDGTLCYEGEAYEEYKHLALEYVQEVSTENASCQELLGKLYQKGHLVTQDIVKACYYHKLAADNGKRVSQYEFALISKNNDDNESFEKYIKESASNGYKPAILEILSDSNRTYNERVITFESYKSIEVELRGSMDLNTDIEVEYSQLVCKAMQEPQRVIHAVILLHNYLTSCERIIGDLKLGKILTTMGHAFDYCRDHPKKSTFPDTQNLIICLGMFRYRVEQLNERNKVKWLKEQKGRAQIQNNNTQKKVMLSAPVNKKVGRNDICPFCDSGKKFKKCCM